MNRVAFRMKLKPGFGEEYRKRHDEIWPEIAEIIRETGVSEYSIFLDEETETLFAVQKVSGISNSQDLGENPVIRKWWEYMAEIMETNTDLSPVTIPLTEVFYLE